MRFVDEFYPESKFGGFTDVDGTVNFYTRVNALINQNNTILEVGCGRGAYSEDKVELRRNLRIFKGKVNKVIGIDVDINASRNPYLDEFRLIENDSWPIETGTIDLVISDFVLEHIGNPNVYFSELTRVVKKGGYVCIRTPNAWGYVAIASRIIPNRFHARAVEIAQKERKEEDVFPAFYRCNSVRLIKRMMKSNGFECAVYEYEAEPSYLSFSKIAFILGVLHQKYAPSILKPAIFAFGKKVGNNRQ
jgi:SAM-dependent methyltransferase